MEDGRGPSQDWHQVISISGRHTSAKGYFTTNDEVAGSNPVSGSRNAGVAQLAEHEKSLFASIGADRIYPRRLRDRTTGFHPVKGSSTLLGGARYL